MTDFSWTVRVRTNAARAVTVHARNHAFSVGDPVSFRPADDLPSALELAAGALAADLANTLRTLARRRRITLDALEIYATCTLKNPLVHLGVVGEEGSPAIERIEGACYLAADADHETLNALWAEARQRSPLYATLSAAANVSLRLIITP